MNKLTTFILLITLLFMFSSCDSKKDNLNLLYKSDAPENKISLSVYYEEALSFGPHVIHVFGTSANQKEVLLIEDKIYNDGSNLWNDNVTIQWKEAKAVVTLSGKEQENKEYEVHFGEGNGEFEVKEQTK